jgi:hypothetical protein
MSSMLRPEPSQPIAKTDIFLDAAVLVKEVYRAATGQMTTGTVSHADCLRGWFVMMKDSSGHMRPRAAAHTGEVSRCPLVRRQFSEARASPPVALL